MTTGHLCNNGKSWYGCNAPGLSQGGAYRATRGLCWVLPWPPLMERGIQELALNVYQIVLHLSPQIQHTSRTPNHRDQHVYEHLYTLTACIMHYHTTHKLYSYDVSINPGLIIDNCFYNITKEDGHQILISQFPTRQNRRGYLGELKYPRKTSGGK